MSNLLVTLPDLTFWDGKPIPAKIHYHALCETMTYEDMAYALAADDLKQVADKYPFLKVDLDHRKDVYFKEMTARELQTLFTMLKNTSGQ